MRKICSVLVILSMIFVQSRPAFAATDTWVTTPGTVDWSTGANWGGSAPGVADTAVFDTALGNTVGQVGNPIVIDSGSQAIDNISYTTAAGNYFVGSTLGNSLELASGGTISILVGLTATNALETISAPLVIEGAGATYTISNNSGNGSGADDGTLTIAGGVTGGTAGATVLTVSGTNTNANTISGIIANGTATTVAVTKAQAGTWVLSGLNTYTGATTITGGTLTAGVATTGNNGAFGFDSAVSLTNTAGEEINLNNFNNTIGSLNGGGTTGGNVVLGFATLTTGALATTDSYAGIISGTGGFTKVGAGTQTLSGLNTYTGATTVSAGTLTAGVATTASNGAFGFDSAVSLANVASAELNLNGFNNTIGSLSGGGTTGGNVALGSATLTTGALNTTDNYGGVISGSGGNLTKVGSGTMTLTGADTYTGNTTVSAGVLNIQNASALGSGAGSTSVTSGATLQIQGGITTTAEALTLNGLGVSTNGALLNISGNNTYAGLITLGSSSRINSSAGTLTLSNAGTITGSGDNLEVGGSGNIVIDSILGTGTGTFTKDGSGTVTLNGANTYTGLSTLTSGTVVAGNASAFGTGAVTNNTTLSLGTTSLNLGGVYTQGSGSTLDLTTNSASSFGSITATGHTAVVNSASTVNIAVGGYIPNNTTFDIINTGGSGVGSAPTTVTSNDSFINFTDSIVNGNLILTANHSSAGFASVASDPNAAAAGHVLDNETNPSSDLANVLGILETSSDSQVSGTLDTLVPVVDRGVMDDTSASLNNFIGASIARVGDVQMLALAGKPNSSGVSAGDDSTANSVWAKDYGSYLNQNNQTNVEGYTAWNGGTAIGVDREIADDITVGASIGYAFGQVNSSFNNDSTISNSAQGTIYAGYQGQDHPYFIDGAGYFAENWYNGERNISIDGTLDRTADSDYDGSQEGVYVGGGYKFDVGNSVNFTPLASLQYTHLGINSYTESNAGSLDLNVNRQSYDTLESGLGARISTEQKYDWGNFTPELHAKWLYDFIGQDMTMTSTFTGGGASFTSVGAGLERNGADIGGSLTFDLKNDFSLVLGVDTEIKDGFCGVSGTGTFSYKF